MTTIDPRNYPTTDDDLSAVPDEQAAAIFRHAAALARDYDEHGWISLQLGGLAERVEAGAYNDAGRPAMLGFALAYIGDR